MLSSTNLPSNKPRSSLLHHDVRPPIPTTTYQSKIHRPLRLGEHAAASARVVQALYLLVAPDDRELIPSPSFPPLRTARSPTKTRMTTSPTILASANRNGQSSPPSFAVCLPHTDKQPIRRAMNVDVLDQRISFRDSFREMLESVSANHTFEECKRVLQQSGCSERHTEKGEDGAAGAESRF